MAWSAGQDLTAALMNEYVPQDHTAVTPNVVNLPVHATNSVHRYKRFGDLIIGEFHFEATGAGSGTFEVDLPATARGPAGVKLIGVAMLADTGTANHARLRPPRQHDAHAFPDDVAGDDDVPVHVGIRRHDQRHVHVRGGVMGDLTPSQVAGAIILAAAVMGAVLICANRSRR